MKIYYVIRLSKGKYQVTDAATKAAIGDAHDTIADAVYVDEEEIAAWHNNNPQPYQRDKYLGLYEDVHGTPEELHNRTIRDLARNGLEKVGHHGEVSAMGVPLTELPRWDDIQILPAPLASIQSLTRASMIALAVRVRRMVQSSISSAPIRCLASAKIATS